MLKSVDCVMLRVPELEPALAFYRDVMGLKPLWSDGEMAGLAFPQMAAIGISTELVIHTNPLIPALDVNYKVDDVVGAVEELAQCGCEVLAGPFPIAIGQCAVVRDPFGNSFTLVDITNGLRTNNLD
jgi:predicted enzyme related to lactoylglutathione lyase